MKAVDYQQEGKRSEKFERIDAVVYPSDEQTISVQTDEVYDGAHCYRVQNCIGFRDGETLYVPTVQYIQFVKVEADGTITPGLQSEQLILILLDRTKKLNEIYPSEENARMVVALEDFLVAAEDRVKDRIDRGVMGKLKK